MKEYRIAYIDGHDLKYKIFRTQASSREDALGKLWDSYESDFDHQIISVEEVLS